MKKLLRDKLVKAAGLKEMIETDTLSQITIISARHLDCPQRGQVISSEYGDRFKILRNNRITCDLENMRTGEIIMVAAARIILAEDLYGRHWHLQKSRNKPLALKTTDIPTGNNREFLPASADKEGQDKEVKVGQLKVLVDEAGHKLGTKIYRQLVSEEDFSSFPQFMAEFDGMLSKYRGDKPVTEDDIEEEDEDKLSGKDEKDTSKEESVGKENGKNDSPKEEKEKAEAPKKLNASFASALRKKLT